MFRCSILLLWIRGAGVRFMSAWCLDSCKEQTPFTKLRPNAYPPMCDLTNAAYSPLTIILQFYSSILMASSEWVAIFKHFANEESNWQQYKHDVRRQIGQVIAEFHRRHVYRFGRWPFLLARLVDHRLSNIELSKTQKQFLSTRRCCFDKGLTFRMISIFNITDVASLMAECVLAMLGALWWAAQICTAAVECEHARNRNLMHFLNDWAFFCAKALHADSKSFLRNKDERKGKSLVSGKGCTTTIGADGIASQKQPNQVHNNSAFKFVYDYKI